MVTKNKNNSTLSGWIKMSIVALIVVVPVIFFYTMFAGYKRIEPVPDVRLTLPSVLKDRIKIIGEGNENIAAIQVVYVDLSQNLRSLRYMYIKDPGLASLLEDHNKSRVSAFYPVFTADDTNNDRITRIINHEFVCSPYEETISAKVVPNSTKYAKVICSLGIPPSYGRFNGILAVLLKRKPTADEIAIIQSYIRKLSTEIDIEGQ